MTLQNNPKISIAIPTFNRRSLLGKTIDSVLEQSYPNLEIIISDNCSTDGTSDLVSAYCDERIIYFRQSENLGMVGNWNFCLEHATGEFFLLLSDDDMLERDAIEGLSSAFSDESVALSYSKVSYIDNDGVAIPGISMHAPLTESGDDFIANTLEDRRVVFPAAALYRTRQARLLGGYPPIGTATDLVLHLMLAMHGRVIHNPRTLVRYRMHTQSLSYSDQALRSQVSLVDWVRDGASPLNKFETPIIRRSINFIFRWGMFCAFEGSRENADMALKVLQRMSPSPKWAVWFYLFNNPIIQLMEKFFAAAKRWVKRLIYR